jgi:hypothetical protein
MLYIQPRMIEPATLSIGLYIIAKSPRTIPKTHKYFNKNPLLIKKKLCKWVLKHHEPLTDTIIEEYNEQLLNIINIVSINPSIFILMYAIALVLIIVL